MLESRNYAWRPGVSSSCCGALAGGKLWVKAGGPATFIDFRVHRVQVASSPNLDFFYSRIARLEGFDIRPVCFLLLFFLGYALSRASWSDMEMAFLVFVADNGE